MVPPQGECKKPLLAVRLAVENLHGTPTASIYGRVHLLPGGRRRGLVADAKTVAIPYHADIIGPFSNKEGGYRLRHRLARAGRCLARIPSAGQQIAAVSPQRLKVWFAPEAFYYADGTQYTSASATVPARHASQDLRRHRGRGPGDPR